MLSRKTTSSPSCKDATTRHPKAMASGAPPHPVLVMFQSMLELLLLLTKAEDTKLANHHTTLMHVPKQ
jgi:hypothetical protein